MAAIRRPSSSATRSASTTCRAPRTGCRSRGWRRRRPPSSSETTDNLIHPGQGERDGMNRAQAPALALLLAACAWVPACGLNQAGVTPPDNTIAFPASAVLDSGANWLFVTNSNADLRYNDGTLLAFSLKR